MPTTAPELFSFTLVLLRVISAGAAFTVDDGESLVESKVFEEDCAASASDDIATPFALYILAKIS